MQRKLTIDLDEHIYEGLYRVIGEQSVSQFIENLLRPYVFEPDLESAYRLISAMRSGKQKPWSGPKP